MPDLSDIVQIDVVTSGAQLATPAFQVPLVLSASNKLTNRVEFFASADAAITFGFASTDPEYKLISKLLAPKTRISLVAVGKLANRPTQRFAVTPTVGNTTVYALEVGPAGGPYSTVSITSGGSATASEINLALKTAIDALSLAITVSDQTTYMRIIANAAGTAWHVKPVNRTLLHVAQDHDDPGVAADLSAIQAYNPGWYAIVNAFNSPAMGVAIAGWVQTRTKAFVCDCDDTVSAQTVLSGATDLAAQLKNAGYTRTLPVGNNAQDKWSGAALLGLMLTKRPSRGVTWAFKTLDGQTADDWNDTEIVNLRARNMTLYMNFANRNVTHEGKNAGGTFFDLVPYGLDSMIADMQVELATLEFNSEVIPYTDDGAQQVAAGVEKVLQRYATDGLLAKNPEPKVIVPKVAVQSSNDRAARYFPGVEFDAQSSGAIHKVGIHGRVL